MLSDLNKLIKKFFGCDHHGGKQEKEQKSLPEKKTEKKTVSPAPKPEPKATPPEPAPKPKPKPKHKTKAVKKKAPRHHNKNGIRKLTGEEDLMALFSEAGAEETKAPAPSESKAPRKTRERKKKNAINDHNGRGRNRKLNKNGIQVLDSDDEIFKLFNDDTMPEPTFNHDIRKESHMSVPEEEDFATMLEESLSGKNRKSMMRAKIDTVSTPRVKTDAQKIKSYPAPQEELDLHGFTSLKAMEKTDLFVRGAFNRGSRTIRIIVGKGLHSEAGAVLPDVVEDRVHLLKQQGKVITYRWENKIKQKSGAMIVYLEYNPDAVYFHK